MEGNQTTQQRKCTIGPSYFLAVALCSLISTNSYSWWQKAIDLPSAHQKTMGSPEVVVGIVAGEINYETYSKYLAKDDQGSIQYLNAKTGKAQVVDQEKMEWKYSDKVVNLIVGDQGVAPLSQALVVDAETVICRGEEGEIPVCRRSGTFSNSRILSALKILRQKKVDVISVPISSSSLEFYCEEFKALEKDNIPVIIPADNSGDYAQYLDEWGCDVSNVFFIASHTQNLSPAPFSSYHPTKIVLSAPGYELYISPEAANESGNSYSQAIAVGSLLLLKSISKDNLSISDIEEFFKNMTTIKDFIGRPNYLFYGKNKNNGRLSLKNF